jgi:hypothetical protein
VSLYHQVLELTTPYFDTPAGAEVFLARQCKQHLNREPDQLGPHDLWELAKWTLVSAGLLIGKEKAERLSDQIKSLRKAMGDVPLRDGVGAGVRL